jgi:hypothetical protein
MVFLDVFGEAPDPRDFTAQHGLPEILFVALAAVLRTKRGLAAMSWREGVRAQRSVSRLPVGTTEGPLVPEDETRGKWLREEIHR